VPRDLYDALPKRAKSERRSIAAEVLSLLEDSIPTAKELLARRKLFKKLRATPSPGRGPFPSAEEMLREHRNR
jgi:hypothetical protein